MRELLLESVLLGVVGSQDADLVRVDVFRYEEFNEYLADHLDFSAVSRDYLWLTTELPTISSREGVSMNIACIFGFGQSMPFTSGTMLSFTPELIRP